MKHCTKIFILFFLILNSTFAVNIDMMGSPNRGNLSIYTVRNYSGEKYVMWAGGSIAVTCKEKINDNCGGRITPEVSTDSDPGSFSKDITFGLYKDGSLDSSKGLIVQFTGLDKNARQFWYMAKAKMKNNPGYWSVIYDNDDIAAATNGEEDIVISNIAPHYSTVSVFKTFPYIGDGRN